MTTHKLCATTQIAKGDKKCFTVQGQKIILYHLDSGFYATEARCPHVFANLAKGKIIEQQQIQCPLHRARFDIPTGEVIEWANFPPGIQLLNGIRKEKALKTWPIIEKENTLYIKLQSQ